MSAVRLACAAWRNPSGPWRAGPSEPVDGKEERRIFAKCTGRGRRAGAKRTHSGERASAAAGREGAGPKATVGVVRAASVCAGVASGGGGPLWSQSHGRRLWCSGASRSPPRTWPSGGAIVASRLPRRGAALWFLEDPSGVPWRPREVVAVLIRVLSGGGPRPPALLLRWRRGAFVLVEGLTGAASGRPGWAAAGVEVWRYRWAKGRFRGA